ncbi:hypothetical protein SLA2020_505050 [Shorea laevis]
MAFAVQDAVSCPNVELYIFHTSSAFISFSILWERTREIPVPKYFPENLPSMEGCLTNKSNSSGENICLNWLAKQPPKSVIYISSGTTSSFVKEQIEELAVGIEESKIRFIWVLGYADGGDVSAEENQSPELPEGFEEKTEGEGMVMRGWVPLAEILKHPSTGGFLSRCGWVSCLEGISSGMLIAAWPMHLDQPRNATWVTQVLKLALRTLMASEEGGMMRKRAEELGRAIRQATEEGGVSRKELESFINHITK